MGEPELRRSIRRALESEGAGVKSGRPITGAHSDLYKPEDDLRRREPPTAADIPERTYEGMT
jgi:hypothetical protein